MNENELWIELGNELNKKGIYFEDLLGHLSVLNADENSFTNNKEMEIAKINSKNFIAKLENVVAKIYNK